jgi:hypothetical protein
MKKWIVALAIALVTAASAQAYAWEWCYWIGGYEFCDWVDE